MDVQVGDVIQTKKPHPCGANRFDVLRVGMDFKIKCQGCGHEIMRRSVQGCRHDGRKIRSDDRLSDRAACFLVEWLPPSGEAVSDPAR